MELKFFILPECMKRVFRKGGIDIRRPGHYDSQPEISRELTVEGKIFWLTAARGEFPETVAGYHLEGADGNAARYSRKNREDVIVDLEALLNRASKEEDDDKFRDRRYVPDNGLFLLYEVSEFEREQIKALGETRTTKTFWNYSDMKKFRKENPLVRCILREEHFDRSGLSPSERRAYRY